MADLDISALAVQAKYDPTLMLPLWEAVKRLVGAWAFKYVSNSQTQGTRLFDTDDLIQSGYIALVDAVYGYDTDSEMAFPGYLLFHVRRRFAEVAGRHTKKYRTELYAVSLDKPIDNEDTANRAELLADPSAEFADDVIEREALYQDCADLLAEADKLPENQRQAFLLTRWDGLTCKAAAEIMGVPYVRANNWVHQAANKIRCSKAGRLIERERYAVHHVGLRAFKSTWTSEVEKYILWAEDIGRLKVGI